MHKGEADSSIYCRIKRQKRYRKLFGAIFHIEKLYAEGKYAATLDSITSLRERFPMAVEARKKALKIWQDASLKMAQKDVVETDVRLQEAIRMAENETDRLKRALLGAKRDSLQARYEAMCGVVRMIRMRQKQQ